MKKLFIVILTGSIAFLNIKAQSTNDILNVLVQNNAITQDQADSLRSEAALKQQDADAKRKLFPVNAGKAFQLGGYTQARYQIDETAGKADGFDIRRAYLNISGVLSPYWSYRFQADFAVAPKLIDAYAEFKVNDAFNFLIGQAVVPFSIDNITSNTRLDFIDRSQVTEALVARGKDVIGNQNGRDLGVQLGGSLFELNGLQLIEYKVALLNGSGINTTDKNDAKDVSARVVLHPVKGLGVGASWYDGVGTHTSPVQNKGRNRLGFELNYETKNLSLRSEYIKGKDGSIEREGYYAQAGYYVLPQKLQLLAKYDVYDPNISVSGNQSSWYIAGVNFLFNPNVKLQINYTIKDEESKSINNNLTSLQMQFTF
jgi:phosphate-selective porin